MNKETKLIYNYIKDTSDSIYHISRLREQYRNQKDFTNQLLYHIMDIVNKEKKFVNLNRKEIDVIEISNKLFS